jgi:hypothetical protein
VVLGIAGEVLFARLAALRQRQLRDRDKRKIADLHLLAEQESLARAKIEETNLELAMALAETEKAILPRRLNQLAMRETLMPFAGTVATVETLPDFECRRIAELLASTLRMAKWRVPETIVRMDNGPDSLMDFISSGVRIERGRIDTTGLPLDQQKLVRDSLEGAISSLMKSLNDNGIWTGRHAPGRNVQPNSIRILVGLKPMPGELPAPFNS